MRSLFLFVTLVLLATTAYAADPTTSMLDAPYVEQFITLSLGPDNNNKPIVKYTLDTVTTGSPRAANGLTFRSDGEIAIHLRSFNPLTQAWVVEAKATPDVSFAAIKGFLDDLTALQAALPAVAAAPPVGGAAPTPPPPNCDTLNTLMRTAYTALKKNEVEADKLKVIVSSANGLTGVQSASNTFAQWQVEIEKNNKVARHALDEIRAKFGSLDQQATLKCDIVTGQILVDYLQVGSTGDRIISAKEALYKQLGDLITTLQPYLQQLEWRGPALEDYEVRTVNPTFADQQAVSVTAKNRSVQLINNSIVVKIDEANIVSAKFDVRKDSFFVAERAAAVIYNRITYPQYGTEVNASGAMIVKRTKDHDPIGGALMLNLVMRIGRGASLAHPLLQLGVSSAKEFPGFLAGVGIRFVEPFNFSLSVGGMITRYKDLDGQLKVGDPVSGTAEINKHLVYKTSDVAIYGAMQLKF